MKKFWKRKKSDEKVEDEMVVINTRRERIPQSSVKKIKELAVGVAKKAMEIEERVYPEDTFLLWLDENKAFSPETAIVVPEDYVSSMYNLWSEGFVAHTYDDRVYATPRGRYVIKILKMKLSGDKRWKQYV